MSYVEKNLMPGEAVIHRTSLHWSIFFGPTFIGVCSLLLFFGPDEAKIWGFLLILFLFLPMFGNALVKKLSSDFAVTDRRVIMKYGLFGRTSLEILLNKIEGIVADEGIGGRIWNYGTIVISGTGSSKTAFSNISQPMAFRRAVHEQIEKVQKQQHT